MQATIDKDNREFWNEICGTKFANALGIVGSLSMDKLAVYDKAFFDFYPYLLKYVHADLAGKKVLEAGLGYGSLGQLLASKGCVYYGLDIADNPVSLMKYRLASLGENNIDNRVVVGSVLDIPFPNSYFDYVYSIGTLHHTGNIQKSVDEIRRVLKPEGKAIIMLYKKYSFRTCFILPLRILSPVNKGKTFSEVLRGMYDSNTKEVVAPETRLTSYRELKKYFQNFSKVQADTQNFDRLLIVGGSFILKREWFLSNIARIIGLEFYITAIK